MGAWIKMKAVRSHGKEAKVGEKAIIWRLLRSALWPFTTSLLRL
jgi:hypothetical protein